MFMLIECKYYAPCGLCTYYDKPCNEVCDQKPKRKSKASSVIDNSDIINHLDSLSDNTTKTEIKNQ